MLFITRESGSAHEKRRPLGGRVVGVRKKLWLLLCNGWSSQQFIIIIIIIIIIVVVVVVIILLAQKYQYYSEMW